MQDQKKGLFCVIEGMDGSGKTTLLAALKEILEGRSVPACISHTDLAILRRHSAVFLSEPTRLPTGVELRRRLARADPPPPEEWIALFRADRRANLDTYVLPALNRGDLVFQDRYYFSTAAYQGAFAEMGPKAVLSLFTSWCPSPDLLVYLDIKEDDAFSRMDERGMPTEVFERRDRWARIRDAYEEVLPSDVMRLDALLDSEQQAEQVLRVFIDLLKRREI